MIHLTISTFNLTSFSAEWSVLVGSLFSHTISTTVPESMFSMVRHICPRPLCKPLERFFKVIFRFTNSCVSGEYSRMSMRNAFILEMSPRNLYYYSRQRIPFPICQQTSMIDRRVRGKPISLCFPQKTSEIESLNQVIRLYHRFNRIVADLYLRPKGFQPLNFFETVITARVRFLLDQM